METRRALFLSYIYSVLAKQMRSIHLYFSQRISVKSLRTSAISFGCGSATL